MKEAKITIWIADDGREFRSESECLAYEERFARVAEIELRLLTQVLASRVSNLFEESASIRDTEFPPELFESFDHCEFGSEFRELASSLNLSPRFLVEHLDAFARLGRIVTKIRGAFGSLPDVHEIEEDCALLPGLSAHDVMVHLESLSRLSHILLNLRSEKDELAGYYWNCIDEMCRATQGCIKNPRDDLRGECPDDPGGDDGDDQVDLWREEMASRDPFEGSPF